MKSSKTFLVSARSADRAIFGRPGPALVRRAPCALLVALFILGGTLHGADGRSFTDLVITGRWGATHLFNRGDGTFVVGGYESDAWSGTSAGDLDRDGDMDFATLGDVYLGRGDFSFDCVPLAWEDSGLCEDADRFSEYADMDADGLMDVVIACLDTAVIYHGTGDERILERGTVLRSGATYREVGEGPDILVVGDLNEDGLPDLKVGQYQFGTQFFLNQGGRAYKPLSAELPPGHAVKTLNDVERWVDFNGDGHLDIVSVRYQGAYAGLLGVYLGDGSLGFTDRSFDYANQVHSYLVDTFNITDIDGDGATDVVLLHHTCCEEHPATLTFLLGRGDGTIRDVRQMVFPYTLVFPDGARETLHFYDLATGDLNGDGIVDIALINPGFEASVLWILDGTGGGEFAKPRILPGPRDPWRIFTLGDIDRQFVRGDASDDREILINDAVVILLALFAGASVNCGQALDSDDDGDIDLTDAVFVLRYLFLGGPPPPAPFPEPGIDTTDPFSGYPGCSPEGWEDFRNR